MGTASFLAGALISVSNDGARWVPVGQVVSTATAGTVDSCYSCGWPRRLCRCLPALPDTRLVRAAFDAYVPPPFGWYRDLERAQPPAKLLTTCATAAQRIWRRLRGHDALQARRQKRRRFVQQLNTAHCA